MVIRNVFCDHCGKGFATAASIQNHQNQPSSTCWKNYCLLLESQQIPADVDVQNSMLSPTPSSHLPSPSSSPQIFCPPIPSSPSIANMEVDIDNDQPAATLQTYTEFFHGASEHFGQGETFMDLFHEDEYSAARQANPHYPFASELEWELGSFLLKSGLSRVAVDEFLKLQLVNIICINLY